MDHSPLKVSGQAKVRLAFKEKHCTQPIYVLHNVKNNLLGLPAIRELQVLSQIHTVSQPVHEPIHTVSQPVHEPTHAVSQPAH